MKRILYFVVGCIVLLGNLFGTSFFIYVIPKDTWLTAPSAMTIVLMCLALFWISGLCFLKAIATKKEKS